MNTKIKSFLTILLLCTAFMASPVVVSAQKTPPDAEQTQKKKNDGGWFSWITNLFGGGKDESEAQPEELGESDAYKELTKDELNFEFIRMSKQHNHDSMAQLLRLGANINAKNRQGRTALIDAARSGEIETAQWLIRRGASVNAKDMYDGTALLYASREGHRDMVNLLVLNGARRQFN
jgi:ankyrin repeat protein